MSNAKRSGSVADAMRRCFISAEPTDNLLQSAQVMQLTRICHLPVVSGGRLLGIVSYSDLMEASVSSLEGLARRDRFERLRHTPVTRVMHAPSPRFLIEPDVSLVEAVEQMIRYRLTCLIVCHEAELFFDGTDGAQNGSAAMAERRSPEILGLITQSDLLAAAYLPGRDARTLDEINPVVAARAR